MAGVATEPRVIRVMGSLRRGAMAFLTSETEEGAIVLDLTAVTDADESAVSLLARQPAGRCAFVGCPRWLAERVERRLVDFASGIR